MSGFVSFLLMCAGLVLMIWIGTLVLQIVFFVCALAIGGVCSLFGWIGRKLNGRE